MGFSQNEARTTICKMLDELNFGRAEPVVRVNSVTSGLAEEDLKITLSAKTLPKTLMLPKVEDVGQINWVSSPSLCSSLIKKMYVCDKICYSCL